MYILCVCELQSVTIGTALAYTFVNIILYRIHA